MLISILMVFSGAFGMIFRVMVIIALCFLAGLLLCALAIFGILRLSRDPDDSHPSDDDFRP